MTTTITPEIRDAIAHGLRSLGIKKMQYTRGWQDLKNVWDKIQRGEILVSKEAK